MKKLDWYILKQFLGTFFFIIGLLISITIVIDLSEKIDNFLDNSIPLSAIVFEYYVNFVPYISALLAPFFVLVAVIFFTSQLANRSEIIAILNSGTSFYRMLYPYFLGATILGTGLWISNNWLVPQSNKKRLAFEHKYINKYQGSMRYNFHRQVAPSTIIYIENYSPGSAEGYHFAMEKFDKGKLVSKIRSEKIQWLKKEKKWRITGTYIRNFTENGEKLRAIAQLDTSFVFEPDDFSFTGSIKEEMTTAELSDHIDYMTKSGLSDIEFYEVEWHRRTSSAFSIYILTLIGVSVASRKVRGGLGWHLVLGIGLSALYEIIMKFSVTFSTNSTLPPFLGVWFPNFVFGALAIYLVRKAPK